MKTAVTSTTGTSGTGTRRLRPTALISSVFCQSLVSSRFPAWRRSGPSHCRRTAMSSPMSWKCTSETAAQTAKYCSTCHRITSIRGVWNFLSMPHSSFRRMRSDTESSTCGETETKTDAWEPSTGSSMTAGRWRPGPRWIIITAPRRSSMRQSDFLPRCSSAVKRRAWHRWDSPASASRSLTGRKNSALF